MVGIELALPLASASLWARAFTVPLWKAFAIFLSLAEGEPRASGGRRPRASGREKADRRLAFDSLPGLCSTSPVRMFLRTFAQTKGGEGG